MTDKFHGGAPRVRREKNEQVETPNDNGSGIQINSELLINKTIEALISAGVAYIISRN